MHAMNDRPQPPRMSRTLRVGIIFLVVCLIAGMALLLYAMRSVVADMGGSYP